jgi:copper homeostasis protein (lipoprotein)
MKTIAYALLAIFCFLPVACNQKDSTAEPGNPESATISGSDAVESSGMDLKGMFRYMADAAVFRDCRDNRVYPVAMESQYIDLERAYLSSGVSAGEEAWVSLQGRYLERPSMEGNINKVKLIVDVFKEISLDETCVPDVHADLQDTYWKLLELQGHTVTTPESAREVHMILASAESRAHGFAGCNNFFGGYQAENDALSFSLMGATMMACPEGMDTEQAFLQALGETTRAEINGQILSLYASDQLLARFEAIYL